MIMLEKVCSGKIAIIILRFMAYMAVSGLGKIMQYPCFFSQELNALDVPERESKRVN